MDFRAYFGHFSLVNRVEHKNLSPNVNLLSITLKFFVTSYNPMAGVVKRTKLNSKKGVMWDTLVHSVTLEYVANIQGPLCLSPFRSQAFRQEGNSFLSGELRYIDGSACDKGTPGTPPPLKQAAIPLARTYSSSSLCLFLELTVQRFLNSIPFVLRLSWQRILPQQAISAHSTLF